MLEYLSAADMGSDFFIIYSLSLSEHTAWFCLNILTIIWPYFVTQVPYTTFKSQVYRAKVNKGQSRFDCTRLKASVAITPIIVLQLVVMDFIVLGTNILLGVPQLLLLLGGEKTARALERV